MLARPPLIRRARNKKEKASASDPGPGIYKRFDSSGKLRQPHPCEVRGQRAIEEPDVQASGDLRLTKKLCRYPFRPSGSTRMERKGSRTLSFATLRQQAASASARVQLAL